MARVEYIATGAEGEVWLVWGTVKGSNCRRAVYVKKVRANGPDLVAFLRKDVAFARPWELGLQKVLIRGTWVPTIGAAYKQLTDDSAVLAVFMDAGGRSMKAALDPAARSAVMQQQHPVVPPMVSPQVFPALATAPTPLHQPLAASGAAAAVAGQLQATAAAVAENGGASSSTNGAATSKPHPMAVIDICRGGYMGLKATGELGITCGDPSAGNMLEKVRCERGWELRRRIICMCLQG